MPYGFVPNKQKHYQSQACHRSISPRLYSSLTKLAKECDVNLLVLVLSAFYALLFRYTNQEKILASLSLPIQGDKVTDTYYQELALEIECNGYTNFLLLLKQITNAIHKYSLPLMALDGLLEEEKGVEDGDYPFAQVNFRAGKELKFNLDKVNTPSSLLERYSPYELDVTFYELEDRAEISFLYAADLFKPSTINRMIEHFVHLLEEVAKYPNHPLSQFEIMGPPEKQQILQDWNATYREYPRDKTIHHLFEEQVEKTPNNIAVVFEGQELTYEELNHRSNQVAHYLREKGVKPDTLVAIACERSLEMIVGILGILKAGGAYVPIDPSFPQERLQFILEDTKAPFLLTHKTVLEKWPAITLEIFLLDQDQEKIKDYPKTNPTPSSQPYHLAYVIYTSGSTGKPKGVLSIHKGAVNRLLWMQDYCQLKEEDCIFQKTPYTFDVSVWELFLGFLSGAKLLFAKPEGHKDPDYLSEVIQNKDVSLMHFVPSMLEAFLLSNEDSEYSNLRMVITSGEALSFSLKNRFFEAFPYVELHNLYGPTEASIDVTFWDCSSETYPEIVPIGKPIWNTTLYILDTFLNPIPVGVTGELYLGGEGLARGYLNRPELTAERFIENPFAGEDEKAQGKNLYLYKTGDLCRWLEDGNVEYIGRSDNQVKIRGFRIELGEIEAALLHHGSIREAVVLAREDTSGNKRLVTYVVFKDTPLETRQLQDFLKHSLPEYMLPSAFVILKALPLTPNGKVDRKGLPAPEYQGAKTYIAPQTPIEKTMCEIWQYVLNVEKVGIYDNFFELGGHSLLATQVISRLRSQYQTRVSLSAFFQSPTIAGLLGAIEKEGKDQNSLPLVPISRKGRLPLSFAQKRLWFIDQLAPNSPLYNIPIAVKLRGYLNHEALQAAFYKLIDRHEVLRTVFKLEGEEPYQFIHACFPIIIPVIDLTLLKEQDKHIQNCIEEETFQQFDLQNGPLLRTALIKLNEREHIFLLTIHHSIGDGWSMGIIGQELSELYNAILENRDPELSLLVVQYADFGVWQKEYLKEEGDIYQKQVSYWTKHLKGAPTLLEIATDYVRPLSKSYQGSQKRFRLSSSLTKRLKVLSEENQATLYMTLLTSFYILLYRYSGQDDIVIGSPIANRNRQEVEQLIGFFVNTLALRANLSPEMSFKELLAQIKEKTLGAYDYQDLPFEKLVDHLKIGRTLSHNPLFQIMFVLQNAGESVDLNLKELQAEGIIVDLPVAKFDLLVSLIETGEDLEGYFEYATDLFKDSTIERMIGNFEKLLEDIAEGSDKPLSQLEMLTPEEKQKILIDWNATQRDYPIDKTIHQLFEEQVGRTPHNTAIVFENEQLTYDELNQRANQLAHYIRDRGIKPDMLVAIACARSLEMVIGILGILKAGGAYVPIDLSHPHDRIRFMLEDANVPLLLTQYDVFERLQDTKAEVFLLDQDKEKLRGYPTINPSCLNQPHHLAYVIYTSGSTGQPKGVTLEHKTITNLVHWQSNHKPQKIKSVSHFANFGFDVSVQELAYALLNGCVVYVSSQGQKDSLDGFINLVANNKINVVFMPTALLDYFCKEALSQPNFSSLQEIIVAGEALRITADIKSFFEKHPHVTLNNHYGPTETHVASSFELQSPAVQWPQFPSIGRPIWNTIFFILSPNLQPVPIGVVGELYIGGEGLARGYLNQPRLTTDKFIENPFASEEEKTQSRNARLYRTGDLCRWLEDGNIEYISRSDDQVKIRGFRIELGEIEAALLRHPVIKHAVVIAREDKPGDKRLVAYIVFKEDERQEIIEVSELQNHLRKSLPDYMMPCAFVTLKAMPFTTNGKVDRKNLPAPPEYQRNRKSYVAPKTQNEKDLCEIWQKVLKIEKVGLHDNFFEMGGHSLLAIQVISRIRLHSQKDMPLKILFSHPTIAELAPTMEVVQQGNKNKKPMISARKRETV